MSVEAKVGFFIVLGITMLFLLTTQVSKFKDINADGYKIKVLVDSSEGLEVHSKVKMNGVSIGWVESFSMENNYIVINLFIKNGFEIPEDSEVRLIKETLLGNRIVEISRGRSSKYLSDGSTLKKYKKYSSFEKTSDSIYNTSEEFRKLASEIRETLNKNRRDDIEKAISNLSIILQDIKEMIKENRDGVKNIVSNFDKASSRLPEVVESLEKTLKRYHSLGVTLDEKTPEILDSIQILVSELNQTVAENRKPLKRTIKSMDGFFTKGEASIKKLDKIISSLTESEIQFSMRSEYNFKDEAFSTYTNISYLPSPSTYYLFSLITAPDFSKYNANGKIDYGLHDNGNTLFSIQYGKRYKNILFRAGVIESTGGVGVDYFAFNDKLKLSLDAFDFNAVNDIRNQNANIKASLRYRVYNHIDIFIGGANLINTHSSIFMGLGFYFIDNDLKVLMGTAGSVL